MTEFLFTQIDYILFCHGLGVLILGAVLIGLMRVDQRPIPWKWAIGFGFCQLVFLWMYVFSLSLENNVVYSGLTRVFISISLVCLFEFARSLTKNLIGKTLPVWSSWLLVSLSFLFLIKGVDEFRLATNYLLRFPTFVFLAFAFYHYRKKYLQKSRLLLLGNIIMLLYGVWILFSPPGEPKNSINLTTNIVATIAALFLAYEFELERLRIIGKLSSSDKKARNSGLTLFVPVIALFVIFGALLVFWMGEVRSNQLKSNFLLQTQTVTNILDTSKMIQEISSESVGGVKNENSYLRHVDVVLNSLSFSNRYFLIGLDQNRKLFYATQEKPTEYGPLNQSYEKVRDVFIKGQADLLGPYFDSEDQWLSALIPLKDVNTGNTVAVLSVERPVDVINQTVFRFRLIPIFAVSLAVIPFIIFWAARNKSQEEDLIEMRRAEKIIARQRVLLDISNSKSNSLTDFFGAVNEKTAFLIEADRFSIWLFSNDGKKLICRDLYTKKNHEHRAFEELEADSYPQFFKTLAAQRSFISDQVANDARLDEIRNKWIAPNAVKSLMSVPLRGHGRLLGIMSYERTQEVKEWNLEDREFCSSVADLVALAIETFELEKLKREKKNLEGQIIHSTKLMAVGTLSSGVAHEINNPLSIIRGYLESNQQKISEVEDLPRVWDRMIFAVERIEKVIRGLRLYSQSTDESIKECSLFDVINHSLILLKPLYSQERVSIIWEDNAGNVKVHGNPGRFQEVLVNLLSNARDALCEVEHDRRITVMGRLEGASYKLDIIDNGPGIKSEYLNRIFDPFFTTKAPGTASGLGLYVAHGTISSYGGSISVESVEGKGTVVHLEIPLAEVPPPRITPMAKEDGTGEIKRPLNILIVDDEQDVREIVSEYLERKGLLVSVARDGVEALELIQSHHYDVIVTDIKMPRMRGDKLIEEAKKIPNFNSRFIVMTGGVEWEDEKKAIEIADFQLRKPFEFKHFYNVICQVCRT